MFHTGIALPFLAALAMAQPIIVKTSTLIDGKGHVLTNKEIVIEGGRITGVADATHRPTLDLSGYTVMPGWIDTHVHITWFFNKDGRLETGPSRTSTAQQPVRAEDHRSSRGHGGETRTKPLPHHPPRHEPGRLRIGRSPRRRQRHLRVVSEKPPVE